MPKAGKESHFIQYLDLHFPPLASPTYENSPITNFLQSFANLLSTRATRLNPKLRAWISCSSLLSKGRKGAARLSFTARIERGPSEGARSASKKDDLAAPYFFLSPILLSVPFHNRSMFPLCLITIRLVISTENNAKGAVGRRDAARMGKRPKAVNAPPDE